MVAAEGATRPKKLETTGEGDLFRARLDQIINLKHEVVQLGGKIDWDWIDREITPLYSDKGRPRIEGRFATYSPLQLEARQVESALELARDITDQMLASERLRDAPAELAHANRIATIGQK